MKSHKKPGMSIREFFHHPHVKTTLNLAFVFMFGFAVATIYITKTNKIYIEGTIKTITENGAIILVNTKLLTSVDLGDNIENWRIIIDGVGLNITLRRYPFTFPEEFV